MRIMSNTYADTAVTKLRDIVAVIDREIVQVPPTPALRAAWTELVKVLALGPATLEPLPPISDEVSP